MKFQDGPIHLKTCAATIKKAGINTEWKLLIWWFLTRLFNDHKFDLVSNRLSEWSWCYSIEHLLFYISVPDFIYFY